MSETNQTVGAASGTERERKPVAEANSALIGQDVELSYTDEGPPIVDVDRIDIPKGEITALVGPNGSGKSTLLKGLSRHLAPDQGSVLLDGRDIQEFDQKDLATELGLLSQENEGPGGITVEKLVYHGRYPHRGFFDRPSEEDHEAVEWAIELAGVDNLRHVELSQLSGGQKQLAWIAMVLAQRTDVLLLDEPTTFLDLHHQLRVLRTIERLNREHGVTVAVVLHDIAQAARFADNIIALDDGEVYDWGPPGTVITEDLLGDVFGVEATVTKGELGPEITPLRPIEAARD